MMEQLDRYCHARSCLIYFYCSCGFVSGKSTIDDHDLSPCLSLFHFVFQTFLGLLLLWFRLFASGLRRFASTALVYPSVIRLSSYSSLRAPQNRERAGGKGTCTLDDTTTSSSKYHGVCLSVCLSFVQPSAGFLAFVSLLCFFFLQALSTSTPTW